MILFGHRHRAEESRDGSLSPSTRTPTGTPPVPQLGLMVALEKLGKKVTAHNLDPVPEIHRFLPQANRVKTGRPVQGAYDALVVLDSDPPRTGLFDDGYPAKTLINVDHHMTNSRIWPLTWLDLDASATGEMIYTMATLLGVPLDREIALCLYTAIFTDTGSYRYSNTTAKCMRISADLSRRRGRPLACHGERLRIVLL